jgi:hypothetical protein
VPGELCAVGLGDRLDVNGTESIIAQFGGDDEDLKLMSDPSSSCTGTTTDDGRGVASCLTTTLLTPQRHQHHGLGVRQDQQAGLSLPP